MLRSLRGERRQLFLKCFDRLRGLFVKRGEFIVEAVNNTGHRGNFFFEGLDLSHNSKQEILTLSDLLGRVVDLSLRGLL